VLVHGDDATAAAAKWHYLWTADRRAARSAASSVHAVVRFFAALPPPSLSLFLRGRPRGRQVWLLEPIDAASQVAMSLMPDACQPPDGLLLQAFWRW
jgi:hypothetical protein